MTRELFDDFVGSEQHNRFQFNSRQSEAGIKTVEKVQIVLLLDLMCRMAIIEQLHKRGCDFM